MHVNCLFTDIQYRPADIMTQNYFNTSNNADSNYGSLYI